MLGRRAASQLLSAAAALGGGRRAMANNALSEGGGGGGGGDAVRLLDAVCVAATNGTMPPTAREDARRVCDMYRRMAADGRLHFARHLASEHAVCHGRLLAACDAYTHNKEPLHRAPLAERLINASQPRATGFIRAVGTLDRGVKFLVDFRADVKRAMRSEDGVDATTAVALRSLDHWLRDAIALWFSVGLLQLERVTWQSSCDMMQKVSEGEAVHPVHDMADMKRRVGLGRRCFAFTHPAMPRQPLVVLHVALVDRMEHSVHNVLHRYDEVAHGQLDASASSYDIRLAERPILHRATTALFYSISQMQPGLSGIDLGNELIKRVVAELRLELPRLTKFATLSPLPHFAQWLDTKLQALNNDEPLVTPMVAAYLCTWMPGVSPADSKDTRAVRQATAALLADASWLDNEMHGAHMEPVLMHWAARYLCDEKHGGKAVCPVANFHLRNGAELWRVNYMADVSPAGRRRSHGVMVHYRYFLDKLLSNADGYAAGGEIWHSYKVKELLDFDKCLKRAALHHYQPAAPSPRHKM